MVCGGKGRVNAPGVASVWSMLADACGRGWGPLCAFAYFLRRAFGLSKLLYTKGLG
jgi:hypothetical protein